VVVMKQMYSTMIGRQTERVEIPSTPSVMLADKGIASPKACNQKPCHIGKENADYKGDTLVDFLLNHVIITFLPTPRLGALTDIRVGDKLTLGFYSSIHNGRISLCQRLGSVCSWLLPIQGCFHRWHNRIIKLCRKTLELKWWDSLARSWQICLSNRGIRVCLRNTTTRSQLAHTQQFWLLQPHLSYSLYIQGGGRWE